jgi:cytochrome P450
LKLLLEWPDEHRRLDEDETLASGAVEEILRFESPNQLGNRLATGPFELQGQTFPEGTQITLGIGAANRDPEVFADPQRFDEGRERNRHLAFASGPHLCAGLSVARMEGRIAIGRFLARFPDYAAGGDAARSRRLRFRGLMRLPVKLRGVRSAA